MRVDRACNSALGKIVIDRQTGIFNPDLFPQKFGVPLENVTRFITAFSVSQNWAFGVVHTNKVFDLKVLKATLNLTKGPKSPLHGMEYFLVQGPLDPFTHFFLKYNNRTAPVGLYRVDPHTLVMADLAPLEKFLEAKPSYRSSAPTAPPPTPGPSGPMGSGMGSGRGPGTGGRGPMGSGRGPMSGPPGMPSGGSSMSSGRSSMPSRGPTSSTPSAPANENTRVPAWMTVDPSLKKIMDKAEEAQPVGMISIAFINTRLSDLISPDQWKIGKADLGLLKNYLPNLKAAGATIQTSKSDQLTGLVAGEFDREETAKAVETAMNPQILAGIKEQLHETLGLTFPDDNNQGNTGTFPPGGYGPGQPPMGGSGPPMGSGRSGPMGSGRSSYPPMGGSGPPMGSGRSSYPPMGGGMPYPPMGPGGYQPSKPASPIEGAAQDKSYVLKMDLTLPQSAFDALAGLVHLGGVQFRGQAEMVEGRPRLFELAEGLRAYSQQHNAFPRGTVNRPSPAERNGRPWGPTQCVSWMAEILRYLPEFNAQFGSASSSYPLGIDITRSWNDKENLFAAQTLIPQFVNAQSKKDEWWVNYPAAAVPVGATHFVGVAGIGLDAPDDTPPNNLRGVFGYDRVTTLAEITDGPENTIAVLQVPPEIKSPWLAGGGSTIRGIPETDSIRPFVCAVYQGKRGTYAIMANGDVRFIPEDIPDTTFKALCTIAGGEKVKVDEVTTLMPAPKGELRTEKLPVAQINWKEYTNPAYGVTVVLTGPAQEKKGMNGTVLVEGPDIGKFNCGLLLVKTPANAKIDPKDLLAACFKQIGLPMSKIKSEPAKAITFQGHPGIEAKVTNPMNETAIFRIYLVDDRIIALSSGPPEDVYAAHIQRFFDSFKLTSPTEPPAKPGGLVPGGTAIKEKESPR